MVIEPDIAHRFISTYMDFLGSLVSDKEKQGRRPTQWLVVGRARFVASPEKLADYRAQHPRADAEMLDAIASLQVKRWLYLKDTKSYSVWLDERAESAYGVLGLTERLRDVAQGQSGAVLHTGLMALAGRWVCDGLMQGCVRLGPGYRREFTATYERLRKADDFSLAPP